MQGSHKGSNVTTLSAGTTGMVQCVCYVDVATAPTLRPGMSIDATDNIWIRQLQQMLSDAHLLPGVTGDYDRATQDAVRTEQAKTFPQPSGIVDTATWRYLTRSLCRRYAY